MRFVLCLAVLLLSTSVASAGKQAFIVGNAAYSDLQRLKNTTSDSLAYRQAFEKLGYSVSYQEDLDLDQMLDAFDVFLSGIEAGDEIAFVFSGHGWSDGQVNYLIPTDAPKSGSDRKLKRSSLALSNGRTGVIDEIKSKGASLVLAIIDACRDNPFAPPEGTKSTGLSRGLARVEAAQETFVIFSAGEGQQALDRLPTDSQAQKLSVFTRNFLPRLTSGMYLEDAISEAQVETATQARGVGGHLQHPAYYDQTLGKTCISGNCADAKFVSTEPTVDPLQCDALYQEAKELGQCFAFQAFLDICSNHRFAPFAKSLMANACQVDAEMHWIPKAQETVAGGDLTLIPPDQSGTVRGLLLGDITPVIRSKLDLNASIAGAVVLSLPTQENPNALTFEPGDIVIQVGKEKTTSFDDVRSAVVRHRLSGEKAVRAIIFRDGSEVSVNIMF